MPDVRGAPQRADAARQGLLRRARGRRGRRRRRLPVRVPRGLRRRPRGPRARARAAHHLPRRRAAAEAMRRARDARRRAAGRRGRRADGVRCVPAAACGRRNAPFLDALAFCCNAGYHGGTSRSPPTD